MQVLSVRAGRKRRSGRRKPSGDLVVVKLSRAAVAAGMPHRRGLPEAVRADERAESAFGRMRLRGHITELQFTAGNKWRKVVGAYLATIGPPHGLAGSGSARDLSEDECERRKRECFEGVSAISRAGPLAVRAINRVVLEDCECPWKWRSPLVWGLVELVSYFGLTGNNRGQHNIVAFPARETLPVDSQGKSPYRGK